MRVTLATEPAARGRANEDFGAFSSKVAVLLDGATVPAGVPGSPAPCAHGARWFTRELGTRILAELSAEPPVWIAEGVARAIDDTAAHHAQTCPIDDQTHPAATIAVLRELPDEYEYYVLGDSTIVFDLTTGEPVARSDKRLSDIAVAERKRVMSTAPGTAARQEALAALIKAEQAHRNVRDGYWIAATNPDVAARGRQGHVRRGTLRRAALLSDGAASAVERYGLMDWGRALDAIESQGPDYLVRQVRSAESADPDGARWPRIKAGDDATVLFCTPDPPASG